MLQSKGMDPTRIATPWSGRRWALATSVAAHALVAWCWLQATPHKPRATAPTQSRAAMTVRLYIAPQRAPFPPAAVEASVVPTPAPHTSVPRPRTRAAAAAVQPRPTAVEPPPTSVAPQIAPSMPAPQQPEVVPGAAFAGMFSPIISRSIGSSGWGHRRVNPAPAPDPQGQREQTLLALRMSLLGRLNDLAGRLSDSGQDLQCDIAIDGASHTADVRCANPADQGAPWSALQGLLVAGTVSSTSADLCFKLVAASVSSEPCGDDQHLAKP